MKEPKAPLRPYEWDYREKTENVTIWSDFEWIEDGDECCSDPPQHGKPLLSSEELSLQEILYLIPKDLSPKDIKIRLFDDSSGMSGPHYSGISFFYKKKIPGRPEEFKDAADKFNQDLEQYKKDKIIYEEWLKNKEIKELEEKLKELKK